MSRMLVAIMSCHRDRPFQQAQRETWLQECKSADYRFFLGSPQMLLSSQTREADEVFLDVDDSYKSLSEKTQAMCDWARYHDYDCMFKCDVDTLVNPRLATYKGEDYMGGENADVNVPGFAPSRVEFCSGGAGYWLSKKSLTIISNAVNIRTQAEDVFVADVLLQHDIKPTFHPGYRWRPGAVMDKDMVTLHLSSALQKKYEPSQMYQAYRQMKETM
jgi:hypothetical protein